MSMDKEMDSLASLATGAYDDEALVSPLARDMEHQKKLRKFEKAEDARINKAIDALMASGEPAAKPAAKPDEPTRVDSYGFPGPAAPDGLMLPFVLFTIFLSGPFFVTLAVVLQLSGGATMFLFTLYLVLGPVIVHKIDIYRHKKKLKKELGDLYME